MKVFTAYPEPPEMGNVRELVKGRETISIVYLEPNQWAWRDIHEDELYITYRSSRWTIIDNDEVQKRSSVAVEQGFVPKKKEAKA